MSDRAVKAIRRALLEWYGRHKRDLPWRRTRDAYSIWISEAMLQQTRVETVIPYYHRFLEKFPDVEALATADLDDVLGTWAGLGYYSRARNLHAAAKVVRDEHGGSMPDDAEGLRELPGIGRYTAGAVASIAFDKPEAIVDGNVARVLSRLLGIREEITSPPVRRRLWEEAAAFADGPHPGDLNQALMELGAMVCTPTSPRCLVCPLMKRCDARRAGDAEELPVKAKKAEPRKVEASAGLLLRRGRALAVRRPPSGLLGGLWELPGGDLGKGEKPATGWTRALRERTGLTAAGARKIGVVEHVFTHRHLRLHVYRCEEVSGRTRLEGFDAHRWLAPGRIGELPHGGVTKKALRLLFDGAGS